MPLSSAQAEARPSLALSTLDLVSPSQVQCLESLLAMTSAGKKKKSIHLHVLQSPGRSEVTQLQVPRPEGLHSSDILFAMEGSCYRAGERRRKSSEGEVSLLKPEDKRVPITQSWFLQNMRATD